MRLRIIEWISDEEQSVVDLLNELVDSDFSLQFIFFIVALSTKLLLNCSSLKWHGFSREYWHSIVAPSQIALILRHLSHCRSFFMISQFLVRIDVLSNLLQLDKLHLRSNTQLDWSVLHAFNTLIVDATDFENLVFHLLSVQMLLSEILSKLLYWFWRFNSAVPGDF